VRYRVTHTTTYDYEEMVSICHNEIRLVPRRTLAQECLRTILEVEPAPAVLNSQLDHFGNPLSFFTLEEPHQRMVLTALSELVLEPRPAPPPDKTIAWNKLREQLACDLSQEGLAAFSFTFESPLAQMLPELVRYAAPSFPTGAPVLEAVVDLTRRIHTDFVYRPGATSVTTPLAEFFAARAGVCQDFAHLEIACLRALGLATRYVSGYVRTERPRGGERLVGADASHAWLSVYCGEVGWVDVDPTNDVLPTDQHLTLAFGRDYGDVSPIKGVLLGGGGHSVEVAVEVVPLEHGLV
jgi:transglutaminase-like putative cysteine protease